MKPLVTIGLPVYNGENYLVEAIDSVLQQTYEPVELVISDNGSTDGTERIASAYASRYDNVHYFRSRENHGASWNYNRTVELAHGSYFRWLAHDDLLAPTLIEKSVAVLEEHADVVLCFTWTQDINGQGQPLGVKQSTRRFDDPVARVRFASMSQTLAIHNCEEVFGLIRTEVLRQTQLIANYTDSDRTLLAQLALFGPFFEIAEPLFLHRIHEESSVVINPDAVTRMEWFDPSQSGKLALPKWRQLRELNRVVGSAPLSLGEQIQCYFQVLNWAKRKRGRLYREARFALSQSIAAVGKRR